MGELRIDQVILLTGRRGVGKTTVCQAVADLACRRGYRPGGVITPALYACPEPFDFTQDRRSRRACPADWELGIGNWELTKVGFEAVDVGSGERWPLARTDPSTSRCGERSPEPCPEPFDFTQDRQGRRDSRRIVEPSGHRRELGGPRVGPYSFDPAALDRALRVLRRAATAGTGATNWRNSTVPCDLLMVDEIGPLELEQNRSAGPSSRAQAEGLTIWPKTNAHSHRGTPGPFGPVAPALEGCGQETLPNWIYRLQRH
jgi:hypothetical protein